MAYTPDTAQKFDDPHLTASGETRARVRYDGTKTIWFNTGTLCNIECVNCYIESSPENDRLVYLTLADVVPYLDELEAAGEAPIEIGFTGVSRLWRRKSCRSWKRPCREGMRC